MKKKTKTTNIMTVRELQYKWSTGAKTLRSESITTIIFSLVKLILLSLLLKLTF